MPWIIQRFLPGETHHWSRVVLEDSGGVLRRQRAHGDQGPDSDVVSHSQTPELRDPLETRDLDTLTAEHLQTKTYHFCCFQIILINTKIRIIDLRADCTHEFIQIKTHVYNQPLEQTTMNRSDNERLKIFVLQ